MKKNSKHLLFLFLGFIVSQTFFVPKIPHAEESHKSLYEPFESQYETEIENTPKPESPSHTSDEFDFEIKNIAPAQIFTLTDEKHLQFLKESQDYVLADTMLNFTWHAVRTYCKAHGDKDLRKNSLYQEILNEQRLWLEKRRDDVASSFSYNLSECEAFTLAIVARTQELGSRVFQKPEANTYLYDTSQGLRNPKGNRIQGGHVISHVRQTSDLEENIILSGQTFAKSGNACEIFGKNILELEKEQVAREQIEIKEPEDTFKHSTTVSLAQQGWLSFSTTRGSTSTHIMNNAHANANTLGGADTQNNIQENQESDFPQQDASNKNLFFALFTETSLYIVHGDLDICADDVSFQGLYTRK